MGLRRGGKAAEEESKKDRVQFGRAEYFKLDKDGDTLTFRLIDSPDDWIYIRQHSFAPTKGAPPDADEAAKAKWPKTMGSTCRRDEAFKNEDGSWQFPDCYLCDHPPVDPKTKRPKKAQVRLWARMVIREAVLGTQEMVDEGLIKEHQVDRIVGFRDEIVTEDEVDKDGKPTGKKVSHPRVVVANMAMDNFFGALQGYQDVYADEGGLLNRDITVTRSGTGTDTEYKFAPRNVTPGHDLADPETKEKYEEFAAQAHLSVKELERMITERASDEFYARFFDPTKPFPETKKKGDGDAAEGAPKEQQQKPPEDPVTQDKLAAMRERVRAGNANPAADAASPEQVADAAVNFTS